VAGLAESAAFGLRGSTSGNTLSKDLDTLGERGRRSYCLLPLTTLGALGFGSSRKSAYGTADLQLMERVADLVALAVENALTRQAWQEEKERLQALLEINSALVSHLDLGTLIPAVRFRPRRAAAPLGPERTPRVSRSSRMMCSRSVVCSVFSDGAPPSS
jgi:hypothetical protein